MFKKFSYRQVYHISCLWVLLWCFLSANLNVLCVWNTAIASETWTELHEQNSDIWNSASWKKNKAIKLRPSRPKEVAPPSVDHVFKSPIWHVNSRHPKLFSSHEWKTMFGWRGANKERSKAWELILATDTSCLVVSATGPNPVFEWV